MFPLADVFFFGCLVIGIFFIVMSLIGKEGEEDGERPSLIGGVVAACVGGFGLVWLGFIGYWN